MEKLQVLFNVAGCAKVPWGEILKALALQRELHEIEACSAKLEMEKKNAYSGTNDMEDSLVIVNMLLVLY